MTALKALEGRMSGLPRKVAAPLTDLVQRGLLSPHTAETVLDAGELSDQSQHLLGFAVAVHALEGSGVPVADTLRMAREQGRRINLHWSANRWKAEHERLARAATLRRLAAENEVYDLRLYERFLPKRWPGYLIRTSRRLGMEGLRQRHCVASYHRMVQERLRAFAVVFVNRTRWTVELRVQCNDERPLAITGIRSRYNRAPGPQEREAIHAHLGVSLLPPDTVDDVGGATVAGPHLQNLRRLLPVLREQQIQQLRVLYGGSGGSPRCDGIDYAPGIARARAEAITVPCDRVTSRIVNGRPITDRTLEQLTLPEAVQEIAGQYMSATDVHWDFLVYGGRACMSVSTRYGYAELDIETNNPDREDPYYTAIDIETGEQT